MTNSIKTAAAFAAAAFAATSAAFAENASEAPLVLDDVYTEIAAMQEKTFELVTSTAEERISASADEDGFEPASEIKLASS